MTKLTLVFNAIAFCVVIFVTAATIDYINRKVVAPRSSWAAAMLSYTSTVAVMTVSNVILFSAIYLWIPEQYIVSMRNIVTGNANPPVNEECMKKCAS